MSGRRIGPISYSNETARWADRSGAGLQVDVQGSYNAQNQFVANTIKFNGNGLHYAIEIQAGITPVEQQEQLQSALDSFPGIRVSRLRGSDLATPNHFQVGSNANCCITGFSDIRTSVSMRVNS
jgi:hypothetical protein